MRCTLCLRVLSKPKGGAALKDLIESYGLFNPTPLTLKSFTEFGSANNNNSKASVDFLKKEIPVRLANIMKELSHLPRKLLDTPSVQMVSGWYEKSFSDILQFEDADGDNPEEQNKFTDALDIIQKRHAGVVETVAQGIVEYRDTSGVSPHGHGYLQYFLDRFYLSRISIRMLIHQHMILFGKPGIAKHPGLIGCIDPHCDVLGMVKDSYENARFLCEQYYMVAPDMEHECVNEADPGSPITMVYVSAHLYYILFELFKNAMRAVVEHRGTSANTFPKIHVTICKATEDVTIKIADRGGGIRRSQHDLLFNYMYSTAPRPASQSGSTSAPLAGYGYGLPISRLYARYFHGDLTVASVEGLGTDAFVYLKVLSSEANELLPVYNRTATKQYNNTAVQVNDWSSPFYASRPTANTSAAAAGARSDR